MTLNELLTNDLLAREFCAKLLGKPKRLKNDLAPTDPLVDIAIFEQRYLDVAPDGLSAEIMTVHIYVQDAGTAKETAYYRSTPPNRECWTLQELDEARENALAQQRSEVPPNVLEHRGLPGESRPKFVPTIG